MSVSREELTNINQVNGVCLVNSIEQIQEIIKCATKNNLMVRTSGSEHSPSASIYSASNRQIKIKLDGKLKDISSFEVDESKDTALVRVGAGCHLGLDPSDNTSTLENSFNYQIDQKGFALPTLGGISHQTVAGFLSTSSSGGTAKHTIADAIEDIGFVDGTGTYRQVQKGEELFNAVGVSMGLLGVITDVTFKLQKRYLVQGKEINQEVKNSCIAGDSKSDYQALDKFLFEDNEYAHINWFAQKYVDSISLWTGSQMSDVQAGRVPYRHALNSKTMSVLAGALLYLTNLLNEKSGNFNLAQRLLGACLKPFVNPKEHQEFQDIWYKALPIDDQAPVDGLINTAFCEIWFPRDQLNEVMHRLKDLFAANPLAAGNFIVELYSAKQSPFMLSPSEGHDAFRVDLYWWQHNLAGDANHYFGLFYEKLSDVPGIRYHWGKHLPHPDEKYGNYTFKPEHLQGNYPKLKDFLAWREKMDPQQLFVTDYWRGLLGIPGLKCGLESKVQTPRAGTLFAIKPGLEAVVPEVGAGEVLKHSLG